MDFALPIALVIVAGLAWDVARRYLGKREDEAAIDALRREVKELRERNDAQVKNLLGEVHDLLKNHDTKASAAVAAMHNGRRQTGMRLR